MKFKQIFNLCLSGALLTFWVAAPAHAISDGEGNDIFPLGAGGEFRVTDEAQSDVFMIIDEATGQVLFETTEDDLTAIMELQNTEGDVQIFHRTGSPEGVITADTGDLCIDTTNGNLYIKTDDGDSTGWTAVQTGTMVDNLYSTDGILSEARIVSMAGSTLTFEGTGNVVIADSGEITVSPGQGLDTISAGPLDIAQVNATSVVIGSGSNTSLTVATDGAGTAEVVLPDGAIDSAEILDATIVTEDVADDTLDFVDFADALTVDASTTVDLDTNAADLNFDANTFVIDSSANSIGIGTVSPGADLDIFAAEDTEFIRLTDSTNADSVGIYTGTGNPDGSLSGEAGSIFLDQTGAIYVNTDGATAWSGVTAMPENFDEVYQESVGDADTNLEIDDASGLTFEAATGDFVVNMSGTTDFKIQDAGADQHVFNDDGSVVLNETGIAVDVRVEGDTDADLLVTDGSADRVGIGTSTPGAKLEVDGAIAATPSTVQTLGGSGSVTPNSTYVQVAGSALGTTDLTSNPQVEAGTAGQMLFIVGTSQTNRIKFDSGNGLLLSRGVSFTLGNNDTLTLIYDGTNWVEVRRSNNPAS